MTPCKLALTLSALLCLVLPAFAADKSQDLGNGKTLRYSLPDGWSDKMDGGTLVVAAPKEKRVTLLLTPRVLRDPITDDKLKSVTQDICRRMAEASVEKKATPEPFKGPAVSGYVFSLTDASTDLRPEQFKFLTAGTLASGDTLLPFTLLYNDKESPERTAAMDILKSLSATATSPATPGDIRAASPDGKWAVLIPGKWQILDDQKSRDGKSRQLQASDDANEIFATIFLEPAAKPGDAKAAREFYFERMKKNPIPMTNVKRSEAGDVAILLYDQSVNTNAHAYLSKNGAWVDVHLSMAEGDTVKNRAALEAILAAIKPDTAKPATTKPATAPAK